MKAVYCIEWTEHERGWGCRPDGFTLHATAEDAKQYIDDYWRMPNSAPDDYDKPGKPFLVEVSDERSTTNLSAS